MKTYSDITLEGKQLALVRGERLLFKQLDFVVNNGDVLQIRGANGAGKTSLLRVICGLIEPDAGLLEFNGTLLQRQYDLFYAHLIYLGHQLGIKQHLTVTENLQFFRNLRREESNQTLSAAVEQVGLKGFDEELAAHLSQGQKRRVSLARLLLEPCPIWILDEPFVALDIDGQAWLSQLFERHVQRGGVILFTSHQSVSLNTPIKTLDINSGNRLC